MKFKDEDAQSVGAPLRQPRSVWEHLMTTAFEQAYVTVNGLRTRYVRAGDATAPAVVMLHGTGGHWEAFVGNLGPLAEHFNCYALDMQGCGFTDKPDKPYEISDYVEHVEGFMDAMGLESAHMIGTSLGGWVAETLALASPGRVDRMILVSSTGLKVPASKPDAIKRREASVADPSWDAISRVMQDLMYDDNSVIDDLVAIRQRVYSNPDIDKIMPRMLTLFDPEIRRRNNLSAEQWGRIQAPTLVIAHVDSPDIFLETAYEIVELMPDAKLQEMHHTSHWSQFEDATEFNHLAIDFLTSSTPTATEQELRNAG